MKALKISLFIGLMVILTAAIPGRVIQADPLSSENYAMNAISKNHPVPFMSTIFANVMITGGGEYTPEVTVNGNGNATHLGRVIFSAEETIVFDEFYNGFADQDFIFTAANGDQLNIHANSNLYPISADPFILGEEGSGTVTGGSGRFEGASGNIVLKASVNIDTWTAQISLKGTIMY